MGFCQLPSKKTFFKNLRDFVYSHRSNDNGLEIGDSQQKHHFSYFNRKLFFLNGVKSKKPYFFAPNPTEQWTKKHNFSKFWQFNIYSLTSKFIYFLSMNIWKTSKFRNEAIARSRVEIIYKKYLQSDKHPIG